MDGDEIRNNGERKRRELVARLWEEKDTRLTSQAFFHCVVTTAIRVSTTQSPICMDGKDDGKGGDNNEL